MVYFFIARGQCVLFMGKDKYENEELLRLAYPEDVWFHVDSVSSAHVYLRLPPGMTAESIPADVLEDCVQLVKANSISGNKMDDLSVVYTPCANLRKARSMDTGQVGFHDEKACRYIKVSTRINAVVNRLNKTRTERTTRDLAEDRANYESERKAERKATAESQRKAVEDEKKKRKEEEELKSYATVMKTDHMVSNQTGKSVEEYEDDFM
eukprot:m51a1_g6537 putative coiled-coil domain-containing (210) ;mRNA; f:47773-49040